MDKEGDPDEPLDVDAAADAVALSSAVSCIECVPVTVACTLLDAEEEAVDMGAAKGHEAPLMPATHAARTACGTHAVPGLPCPVNGQPAVVPGVRGVSEVLAAPTRVYVRRPPEAPHGKLTSNWLPGLHKAGAAGPRTHRPRRADK